MKCFRMRWTHHVTYLLEYGKEWDIWWERSRKAPFCLSFGERGQEACDVLAMVSEPG